ncbi:MAG TPA: PadR family transcriptional regulator [Candidatus Baltobacteraceae bacterium]|jgi:DNA-binding PadR family transcriptional regulator
MQANRRTDPAALLPLGAGAFHILLALADGDRHGYSISKEVEESTGGTVRLGPGTLYRLLKEMLANSWIVEIESDDADDARRRNYRLTAWGRRIAQAEASRLDSLVRIARSRHLLPA